MKFYLVGGFVRDNLLGLKAKDRDWVVVGSTYKKMVSLGYKPIGKYFPVFLHPITKEEYALARTEKKNGKGYNGFLCNFSKSITLKEDLYRRDLTINAISVDKKGKYFDPFNGILDINNKIIRHVSIHFIEDPLRVLRVARFFSKLNKFNFFIHKNTWKLIFYISKSNELLYLTPERVWLETEKVIKNNNIYLYFYTLYKCDALNIVYPELNNLFVKKKFLFYFNIIFNNNLTWKNDIKVNFFFLCLFFYDTFFCSKYILNKSILINHVFNFCKRLCIPKKFFFFFKKTYKVLRKIYFFDKYNYSKLFLDIYMIYDFNRNYFFIDCFLVLIKKIFFLFFFKNKKVFIFLNKYFIRILHIIKNIKYKKIINLDIKNLNIKKKIYNIRYKEINNFFKNIF